MVGWIVDYGRVGGWIDRWIVDCGRVGGWMDSRLNGKVGGWIVD